jgi:hypothetical protein
MTENEVKETKEWLQDFIRTFGCNFDDLETRGFNECVMFLKELEQYRAIGTVEEIKSEHKELIKLSRRYLKDTNELIKYQEIGTIDEFKDLKEKSEAKKPLRVPTDDTCLYCEFRCPSCGEWLSREIKRTHCKCNQKLDWQ